MSQFEPPYGPPQGGPQPAPPSQTPYGQQAGGWAAPHQPGAPGGMPQPGPMGAPAPQGDVWSQQPISEAERAQYAHSVYGGQQLPPRSKGKLIGGIILVVVSSLMILGRMASSASGRSSGPSNPAEALGSMIGLVLFLLVPLGIGIYLIATSRRWPKR